MSFHLPTFKPDQQCPRISGSQAVDTQQIAFKSSAVPSRTICDNLNSINCSVRLRFVLVEAFSRTHMLPDGKKLATLRDAGDHIRSLPNSQQDAKQWQTAMHCLIEAADHGGSVMNARIGVSQALCKHFARNFDPIQKTSNVAIGDENEGIGPYRLDDAGG